MADDAATFHKADLGALRAYKADLEARLGVRTRAPLRPFFG